MKKNTISIKRFIQAFAMIEEIGGRYLNYLERWQNHYNIVEAWEFYNQDLSIFGDKLGRTIAEYGISHFRYQENKYAKKAYLALLRLDKEFYLKSGEHFKGFTKCITYKEMADFLIKFDDAYNHFMAGGHIQYEDR